MADLLCVLPGCGTVGIRERGSEIAGDYLKEKLGVAHIWLQYLDEAIFSAVYFDDGVRFMRWIVRARRPVTLAITGAAI
ncbi:MAG: hypothetical protein JXA20_16590 [Spirochaetes bacterium]|nr:hypothetical protein [Spirochaetota bacterium]